MNILLVTKDENLIKTVKDFIAKNFPSESLVCVGSMPEHVATDVVLVDIVGEESFLCAKKASEESESVIALIGDERTLINYAAKGYEIGAVAFLKKPLTELILSLKLTSVFRFVKSNQSPRIMLEHKDGVVKISEDEIIYVELIRHKLIYHTLQGEFTVSGSMKQAIGKLQSGNFAQCNSCYLVNLKYVVRVEKNTVVLEKQTLQISREGRKKLLRAFMDYYERGNGA